MYTVYKNSFEQPVTHYIDVRQGAVIQLLVSDEDIIQDIYDDRYKGRLKKSLVGKPLEELHNFLKEHKFIGFTVKSY